jgi:hypothetical protein
MTVQIYHEKGNSGGGGGVGGLNFVLLTAI